MNCGSFEIIMRQHAVRVKESMAAPFEKETEVLFMKKKSARISAKTLVIAAIIVCFALGGSALAAGIHSGWFAAHTQVYETVPAAEELEKNMGYAPALVERFDNGFAYSIGYGVDNEIWGDDGGLDDSFKSAMLEYERDGETVLLSMEKSDAVDVNGDKLTEFEGVQLYYYSYLNKVVPEDYRLSAEEQAARERGEIIFSFGSDSVDMFEVKSLQWLSGGVHYCLMQMGGSLDAEELCAMAFQLIGG